MKRCKECRGRGTEKIAIDSPDYLTAVIENRKRDRDGSYLKPCSVCNGKGFLNPRFK